MQATPLISSVSPSKILEFGDKNRLHAVCVAGLVPVTYIPDTRGRCVKPVAFSLCSTRRKAHCRFRRPHARGRPSARRVRGIDSRRARRAVARPIESSPPPATPGRAPASRLMDRELGGNLGSQSPTRPSLTEAKCWRSKITGHQKQQRIAAVTQATYVLCYRPAIGSSNPAGMPLLPWRAHSNSWALTDRPSFFPATMT